MNERNQNIHIIPYELKKEQRMTLPREHGPLYYQKLGAVTQMFHLKIAAAMMMLAKKRRKKMQVAEVMQATYETEQQLDGPAT